MDPVLTSEQAEFIPFLLNGNDSAGLRQLFSHGVLPDIGDTLVLRCYGHVLDKDGKVQGVKLRFEKAGQAWMPE